MCERYQGSICLLFNFPLYNRATLRMRGMLPGVFIKATGNDGKKRTTVQKKTGVFTFIKGKSFSLFKNIIPDREVSLPEFSFIAQCIPHFHRSNIQEPGNYYRIFNNKTGIFT